MKNGPWVDKIGGHFVAGAIRTTEGIAYNVENTADRISPRSVPCISCSARHLFMEYPTLVGINNFYLFQFLRPSAGSSGIPELIGFLNGTVVRHIFNLKTMVVKFFSCCCAVGSGMPVGPEGPMIHLG